MTRIIRKKEEKEPKAFPFKIGADPEFNIMIQNQRISAQKLIQALFIHKLTPRDMGYEVPGAGEIGWDGACATGEVRPKASNKPKEVINHLRKIIKSFSEQSKLFELSTKSSLAPIGGHVHFELNENQLNGRGTEDTSRKMANINKKLGIFYLPIMLGEDNINLRIRLKSNYGKLDDFRVQKLNNGATTLEFRTPTAEWLTTPEIAEATLAYLACAYNEIVNHPKKIEEYKNIFIQSQKQATALQELALARYIPITSMIMNKVKKAVKRFEYYPEYKEQINLILSPKKILAAKEKVNYDIMQGWGFSSEGMPPKRDFLIEKNVKMAAEKVNLDILAPLIYFPYNDDTNVADFVRALQKRIIAFNCKLKKRYFAFGLRPGIKDYMVTNRHLHWIKGQHQIKTISDLDVIESTLDRMSDRFRDSRYQPLDYRTSNLEKQILIGIPYQERINLNLKPFLEIIYDIEKDRIKPEVLDYTNRTRIIDDNSLPDQERGELWKLYNLPDQSQEIADSVVPPDAQTVNAIHQIYDEDQRANNNN